MLPIIFSIIPGGSTLVWIAVAIAFITLFWNPIVIGLFIFVYELLLRLDLYGGINKLVEAFLVKKNGSGFFSSSNEPMGAETKKILFGLSSPFKALLNINRGLLYAAFFITLIGSFPLSLMFKLQGTGVIFGFIDTIINLEFPVLTLLIGLVVVDKLSDIMISISGIVGRI